MEKISQLMDGELEGQECSLHIRRLAQDRDLAKRWDTYHLIRDVLRGEAGTRVDLVESVRVRLRDEPTVLAPKRRIRELTARYAMPVAAAVAGITVVGWLTMTTQPTGTVPAPVATPPAPAQPQVMQAAAPANAQVNEYLLAHQEFSPTTVMHSAASYVRTLSVKDADNAQ